MDTRNSKRRGKPVSAESVSNNPGGKKVRISSKLGILFLAALLLILPLLAACSDDDDDDKAQSNDVESRLAIMNLEGEYARTWDTGDAEGWARLFTEDGVFEMVEVGPYPAGRMQGHQELAGFCQQINSEFGEGLHLIHVPALSIEGDNAEGWVHFEWFNALMGHVTGVYQVTYVRTESGWHMVKRVEQIVEASIPDPESAAFYGVPQG
ncbi:nuclear transport factor 2 family protein [Chloroflexota bacterium]